MRSGETRWDISRPAPMRQIALPQGLSVSRSLAKLPAFADWRDIANLAYWVTGTEGSNPSLSATQLVVFSYSPEMATNSRVGGPIRAARGTGERDQSCKSPIRHDSSLFRRDSVPRADSVRSPLTLL